MKNQICIASDEDLDQLVNLLKELFSQDLEFEPDYEKQKTGLNLIIQNNQIGEILVLKHNNIIIGMVSLLYSISTALGGKVAILEDMIIDKDYRNKKYGTGLLNEAIRYAEKKDCLRITLLTDYNNNNAISFYKKAGFTNSKMIPMRLVFENKNLV